MEILKTIFGITLLGFIQMFSIQFVVLYFLTTKKKYEKQRKYFETIDKIVLALEICVVILGFGSIMFFSTLALKNIITNI